MKKFFLVGMPGSGKTTAGRGLAFELGLPFVDLDDEIVKVENMPITSIFSQKGEEYFRKSEQRALHKLLEQSGSIVVSCGGGTPCFFDNMDQMNKCGTTIFIDVPLNELVERISRKASRPLLNDTDQVKRIHELYEGRIGYYHLAKHTISSEESKFDLIKKLTQLLTS